MIYEGRLNAQSRGLVYGPSILSVDAPVVSPIVRRRELILESPALVLWRHQVTTYKIVIKSREGGETLWVRPFATVHDAFIVWQRLLGLEYAYQCPGTWTDGDLVYEFATVQTFNSTPGGGTFTIPAGVSATDYLVVAGAGSGATGTAGGYYGGSGGAGALNTSTNFAVVGGQVKTVTVGAGGTAPASSAGGTATNGANGTNSVFDSVTSVGGGGGGRGSGSAVSTSGSAGGSGGGGGGSSGGSPSGGGGTSGTGLVNSGGNGSGDNSGHAGGGGGSAAAGTGPSASGSSNGGAGTSNSISGGAVTYGVGGNIAAAPNSAGASGTANRGNGGQSCDGGGASSAGNGGSGVVILSYTAVAYFPFNRTRNYISQNVRI